MTRSYEVTKALVAMVVLWMVAGTSEAALVAYYDFEEGGGSTAADAVSGFDATLQGGSSFTAGFIGAGAVDLPGNSGGYLSTGKVASDLGIDGSKPKTIVAWARPEAFNNGGIFGMGSPSTGNMFSLRTLGSDDVYRAQFWGSGNDFDVTVPGSKNNWNHYALVDNGTTGQLYINGQLVGAKLRTINTSDGKPFEIGRYNQSDGWNGQIDELAVYSKALSSDAIQGLANQTYTPTTVPLSASKVSESFDYPIDGSEGSTSGGQNGAGSPKLFSTSNGLKGGGAGFAGPWRWSAGNPDSNMKIAPGLDVPDGVASAGGALQLYRADAVRTLDGEFGGAGTVNYVTFAMKHSTQYLVSPSGFALTKDGVRMAEISRTTGGNSEAWDFIAGTIGADPDNMYGSHANGQHNYWVMKIDQTGPTAKVSIKRYEESQHDTLADSYDFTFEVPHFTFDGVNPFFPDRRGGLNISHDRASVDEIRVASTFEEAVGQEAGSFIPRVIVRTGAGRGGDAQVNKMQGDTPDGTGTSITLLNRDGLTEFNSAMYMKFDLDTADIKQKLADGLKLTDVTLMVTLSDGPGSNESLREINVWGLLDEANADGWDESTLTWNTAPGILPLSGGQDGSQMNTDVAELLGVLTFTNTGSALVNVDDELRFSSQALLNLILNDTDGQVTLVFKRATPSSSVLTYFAAHESDINAAPGLIFTFEKADAPVPEPGTALLGLLAAGSLLGIRRRCR